MLMCHIRDMNKLFFKKKKMRYGQIEYWLFVLFGSIFQNIIKAGISYEKAWGSAKWGILCKEN